MLISAVLILVIFVLYLFRNDECLNLDCISFVGRESYQLDEVFVNQDGSFLAEYKNENSTLRLEVVEQNNSESNDLIKSRVARIQAQYEESISPYPGEISDSVTCPPELKPNFIVYEENDNLITAFMVKLNERMVTGQCDDMLTKYDSYNYYFHCRDQGKTFFVETIYEKDYDQVEKLSFICN